MSITVPQSIKSFKLNVILVHIIFLKDILLYNHYQHSIKPYTLVKNDNSTCSYMWMKNFNPFLALKFSFHTTHLHHLNFISPPWAYNIIFNLSSFFPVLITNYQILIFSKWKFHYCLAFFHLLSIISLNKIPILPISSFLAQVDHIFHAFSSFHHYGKLFSITYQASNHSLKDQCFLYMMPRSKTSSST